METADGTTLLDMEIDAANLALKWRKENFISSYVADHFGSYFDGEHHSEIVKALTEARKIRQQDLFFALADMAVSGNIHHVHAIVDDIIDSFLERKAAEEFEKLLQS